MAHIVLKKKKQEKKPQMGLLFKTIKGFLKVTTLVILLFLVTVLGWHIVQPTMHVIAETPESFTIIVLTDTQYYTQKYPTIFTNQTRWIVNEKESRNIVFVSHAGDIVENYDSIKQWNNANNSMSVLLNNDVPYGYCAGNHDQEPWADENGTWRGDNYRAFNCTYLRTKSYWYNDTMEGKNNAQTFSVRGNDFIIIHVEHTANSTVLAWVNQTLQNNSNKRAIITTHGLLNATNGDWLDEQGGWQYTFRDTILKPNSNVFLALCGHHSSTTYGHVANKTVTSNGHTFYTLLQDWQFLNGSKGGDGWLRILTFFPKNDSIHVQSYSPYKNQWDTGTSPAGFPYDLWLTFDMTHDIHDVAIVSVTPSITGACQGQIVSITVIARNEGTGVETFNVTAYYDNITIGTKSVENLLPSTEVTLSFIWNTTDLSLGEYTISAKALPVPDETDTADNTYTYGTFLVTIPGDVNDDRRCDMKDIYLIIKAFNSKPGQPKWNPECDINNDGVVDMKDLYIAIRNFMKSW